LSLPFSRSWESSAREFGWHFWRVLCYISESLPRARTSAVLAPSVSPVGAPHVRNALPPWEHSAFQGACVHTRGTAYRHRYHRGSHLHFIADARLGAPVGQRRQVPEQPAADRYCLPAV